MADPRRPNRSRIVVGTSPRHNQRVPVRRSSGPRNAELWAAISIVAAAALATFVALFLTSRPYDPMDVSVEPQNVVPAGPSFTPSPKSSASATPTPQAYPTTESSPAAIGGETSNAQPDDATIQSNIERALTSDPALAGLDVSTLVENGKVTVVGSVRSADLKQRVERTIRSIKGVSIVDNQLVITAATPGGIDLVRTPRAWFPLATEYT